MDALGTPAAAPPVMFGAPAPARRVAAVVVGPAAAGGRPHLLDRHHPPGWPCPLPTGVGTWLPDGFWFSTGSLARRNLAANPQITMHLDSGTEVVIVEGVATAVTGAGQLRAFLAAYNTKYNWDAVATDQRIADSSEAAGLAGAPLLGATFALSWTPCLSPTLTAVLGLAAVQGSAARGTALAAAYSLGMGLPFIGVGAGLPRLLWLSRVVRRHGAWVTRLGGVPLVAVGLALVTGGWTEFINWLRATVGPGQIGI